MSMNTTVLDLQKGAATPREQVDATFRKVSWRLIPMLFLCYVMNYLDRINIGYAQLQMRTDLGFTDAVYGLGASMFFVGYFLFEVPSNLYLQKVGARKTLLRIMVLWGVVSAATLFVQTSTQFYVQRFLLGVFEAGFFPGIVLYLTFWYPPERRARVVALFMSAIVVAGIVAGPTSGWILQHLNGWHGMKGWQWMYLIEGLPSAFLGVVAFLWLADSPRDAKWLSPLERSAVEEAVRGQSRDMRAHAGGGLHALRDKRIYLFAFLYFAMSCGGYTLNFWMPAMIQGLGVTSPQLIGLYTVIPYTFAAIVTIWWGRRSDRLHERRWHFALAALVGAVSLSLTTVTTDLWLSVALMAMAGAGAISSMPVFWATATSILPKNVSVAGIAAITSIGSLAGVVCPYALGLIKTQTGSLAGGLYAVSAVIVGAALVMLLSRATRPLLAGTR
jgi:D-galactonate transporter